MKLTHKNNSRHFSSPLMTDLQFCNHVQSPNTKQKHIFCTPGGNTYQTSDYLLPLLHNSERWRVKKSHITHAILEAVTTSD